ncbi:hypothetical protein HWV62_32403 [Athelia sp. TMB]|nr:hypothetical protein HWV62_32403 [Athelia sp. TMB]
MLTRAGLMMGVAATSIVAGVFDVKHYLHLQLVPHISQHHQYWRLLAHQLAFADSSDLFVAELVLWHVGVHVERQFGSLKYASFALLASALTTLLAFLALLLLQPLARAGLQPGVRGGPAALVFAVLWQYVRIVPRAYAFRVLGLVGSNKAFVYVLAAMLALSAPLPAATGLLAGALYRSDLLPALRAYRLPPRAAAAAGRWGRALVGSTRAPRRLQRAIPEERERERVVPITLVDESAMGAGTTAATMTTNMTGAAGFTLDNPPARRAPPPPPIQPQNPTANTGATPPAPTPRPASAPATPTTTTTNPLQTWLASLPASLAAPSPTLRAPPPAEIARVAGILM